MKRKIITIIIMIMLLFSGLSFVKAQENLTNVTITNIDTNVNTIMINFMFMFLLLFSLLIIVFIKIPILQIFCGFITMTMSFLISDVIFYPYINVLLMLFGMYEVFNGIKLLNKRK